MSNDAASEFAEACADQRWFVDEGWVRKQKAVDNLQLLAERGGYVDEIGQDDVQLMMSEAFATMPDLPSDYVTQMLRQWEMWDARDRWRHTGELPPGLGPGAGLARAAALHHASFYRGRVLVRPKVRRSR